MENTQFRFQCEYSPLRLMLAARNIRRSICIGLRALAKGAGFQKIRVILACWHFDDAARKTESCILIGQHFRGPVIGLALLHGVSRTMKVTYELTRNDLAEFIEFHQRTSPAARRQNLGCLAVGLCSLMILPVGILLTTDKPVLETLSLIHI